MNKEMNKQEKLYKVGDKVLIRKDLVVNETYCMNDDKKGFHKNFVKGMKSGFVDTIDKIASYGTYKFKSNPYYYTDEMIEGKITKINNEKYACHGDKILVSSECKFTSSDLKGELVTVLDLTNYGYHVKRKGVIRWVSFASVEGVLVKRVEEIKEKTETKEVKEEMVNNPEVKEQKNYNIVLQPSKDSEIKSIEDGFKNTLCNLQVLVERAIVSYPAVILFYREGTLDREGNLIIDYSKKAKKVIAKAQHGDTFDTQKGLSICMYKVFNRVSAKRIKELSK